MKLPSACLLRHASNTWHCRVPPLPALIAVYPYNPRVETNVHWIRFLSLRQRKIVITGQWGDHPPTNNSRSPRADQEDTCMYIGRYSYRESEATHGASTLTLLYPRSRSVPPRSLVRQIYTTIYIMAWPWHQQRQQFQCAGIVVNGLAECRSNGMSACRLSPLESINQEYRKTGKHVY